MNFARRRILSFVFGGMLLAAGITLGIVFWIQIGSATNMLIYSIAGVVAFTLVSCLILGSNMIGKLMLEIFLLGFVKFPGLVLTLDLDGIIWLLTVKLLLLIIGLILGVIYAILAIIVGAIVSVFVYPLALVRNIREIEKD